MTAYPPPWMTMPLMGEEPDKTTRKLRCRECGDETWHEVVRSAEAEEVLECRCGHKSTLLIKDRADE